MPIKEKKILSARYLWKIFTYTMDIAFLIASLSIAQGLYRIANVEKMQMFLSKVSEEKTLMADGMMTDFALIVSVLVLFAFLGLLLTLRRLVLHELSTREKAERLMSALGYRKRDIILYEEGYALFDIIFAYVVSAAAATVLGYALNGSRYIAALSETLGRATCMTKEAYIITAVAVLLVIGFNTAWQIHVRQK